MNNKKLAQDLRNLDADIDIAIFALKEHASIMGIDVYRMQYADGAFALPPLLSAKAMVLSGLAYLKE